MTAVTETITAASARACELAAVAPLNKPTLSKGEWVILETADPWAPWAPLPQGKPLEVVCLFGPQIAGIRPSGQNGGALSRLDFERSACLLRCPELTLYYSFIDFDNPLLFRPLSNREAFIAKCVQIVVYTCKTPGKIAECITEYYLTTNVVMNGKLTALFNKAEKAFKGPSLRDRTLALIDNYIGCPNLTVIVADYLLPESFPSYNRSLISEPCLPPPYKGPQEMRLTTIRRNSSLSWPLYTNNLKNRF